MLKHLLVTAFVILCWVTVVSAHDVEFEWSFVTSESSPGPPRGAGHVIRGTISGLAEGNNDGSGLTVVVAETPNGKILGGDWEFSESPEGIQFPFVVSDGDVVFADAAFIRRAPPGFLQLGDRPLLTDGFLAPDHSWHDRSGGGTRFRATIVPTLGDFNGDGLVDIADIDLLSQQIRIGSTDLELDVNGDLAVNSLDRKAWVHGIAMSYLGDANLDGEFDSGDLIQVFAAGEYEDAVNGNSGWADGDWNGDGDFDTSDLVVAFQDGGFERGPRQAAAVPEPSSAISLALCAALVTRMSRKHSRV